MFSALVCSPTLFRAMKCAGENEVLIVLWNLYSVSAIRLFMEALCNGSTSVIVKPNHGSAKMFEAIKKHKVSRPCVSLCVKMPYQILSLALPFVFCLVPIANAGA